MGLFKHYSHFKVYFGAWFKWAAAVLHRSMMAHTKVRIQRYVSLKKKLSLLVISQYKSNAICSSKNWEEHWILSNHAVEYWIWYEPFKAPFKIMFFALSTIFLRETSTYFFFFFKKKTIFVKLCMWSFSWNLIPSTNMPKVYVPQWWKSKMQTDYAIIEVHFVHQWKKMYCVKTT